MSRYGTGVYGAGIYNGPPPTVPWGGAEPLTFAGARWWEDPVRHFWWDDPVQRPASLFGWWDLAAVQPVEILGQWNGIAVVPIETTG